MQDRFKFRIFCKSENKMMLFNNPTLIDGDILEGGLLFKNYDHKIKNVHEVKTSDLILMQCTGLKDRNGKLIYEGDIVKFAEYDWSDFAFKDWEQEITEIIWGGEHNYPAFDLKIHNFDCNGLVYIFEEGWQIEVIGNIYENKELLGGANE